MQAHAHNTGTNTFSRTHTHTLAFKRRHLSLNPQSVVGHKILVFPHASTAVISDRTHHTLYALKHTVRFGHDTRADPEMRIRNGTFLTVLLFGLCGLISLSWYTAFSNSKGRTDLGRWGRVFSVAICIMCLMQCFFAFCHAS